MASVTLWGASYSDVPAITVPQTGGGTVTFYENGGGTPAISVVDTTDTHGGTIRTITALDISDTTATAADVLNSKYFYTAQGVKTQGTATGGGGATHHTIHLEFSDSTDTDIDVYYDDSLIGTMITAYQPSTWTYSNKTVYVAELDNVEWYNVTPSPATWETLFNGTESLEAEDPYPYFWIEQLGNTSIPVGSVWRITLNSVEYILTATAWSTSMSSQITSIIGNPLYSGGTDDGSGVPFNLFWSPWGAWSGGANLSANTPYPLKIERQVTS